MQARKLLPQFTLPHEVRNKADPLPPEGRQVLEALVCTAEDEKHLKEEAQGQAAFWRLSIDLAVYTSFCKLLGLYQDMLEGSEGTGPLEADLQAIEAGPDNVPAETWHCIIYRAGQKRIVRSHLQAANKKLEQLTSDMQAHVRTTELGKDQ